MCILIIEAMKASLNWYSLKGLLFHGAMDIMITYCISTSFTIGQFLTSLRAASRVNTSPPPHRFFCPTASPPLYYPATISLYQWGRKRVLISFNQASLCFCHTHKKAARTTQSSEREGRSSSKIRPLTPLTYTPFYEEQRIYAETKMWLLCGNAPTLAEPYPEETNLH